MTRNGDCITNVVAMSLLGGGAPVACTMLSYYQIIPKQNSAIVAINVTATKKQLITNKQFYNIHSLASIFSPSVTNTYRSTIHMTVTLHNMIDSF
jgi:hypothetical protein